MSCLLFTNTSCSPKQKSTTILLYYKKYISVERSVYNKTIADFCFGEHEVLLNSNQFILTSASRRSI